VLYSFLTGNYPISMIIAVFVGLWAYRSRDSILRAMNGDTVIWNLIGRVAVGATVFGFVWITVFDNWRQMLGYLVQERVRYRADPMQAAIVGDEVRTISLVLLGVSAVALAAVYARHRGPFVFLVISLVFAPLYAFVFNEVRMRADVFLRFSDTALASGDPVDIGFVLFWASGLLVIIATVVVTAYLFLFAVVALPIRVIYAIATRKQEPELSRMFRFYERRARGGDSKEPPDQDAGAPLNSDARPG
jgi:type IV secretory pathway VirB3-like protein